MNGGEPGIERFRTYLLLLARMQLDPRWRVQVDPSDLVQQTLLEAHEKQAQFQGDTAQVMAWLRKSLANNLVDRIRALGRDKRDVRREVSLAAIERSSAGLGELLAAHVATPSERAMRNEELLRLADALAQLSDAQREAIVLHHLQGCTLAETARALGRSEPAVAGLLHRGLKNLRESMA